MLSTKELIEKLPSSWNDLQLKNFMKIMDVEIADSDEFGGMFNGVDNTIRIASVLTGVASEDLEKLPFKELNRVGETLTFMTTEPAPAKTSTIQWKSLENVSYNDYVTFISLSKEPLKHLVTIIKAFSVNEMTEEQIENLSTQDAMSGFFLLNSQLNKYLRRIIRSTTWKLKMEKGKQAMKQLFKPKTTK